MPGSSLALLLPRMCDRCAGIGTVDLQHVVRGEKVLLEWRCNRCQHKWSVNRDEETASYGGPPVDDIVIPPTPLCRTCETAERVCLTFITETVVHWLCLRCGEKWEAERLTAEQA